jgi:DNA polymerase-4
MNPKFNPEEPQVMHIDLNSAFATTEQQARPHLRGVPMGVTNRISKYCCVIAASYEAKALGIKVGMNLVEARAIYPGFVILESDPPKYTFVYKKLAGIISSYSPDFQMKSIDEGVVNFRNTKANINTRSLEEIGYEIKARMKSEVGSWMKVNIGIGPNRFLAKQAAGLHKPDGLDTIDYRNYKTIYKNLKLTDLTGIGTHFEARLNANGIFTPTEFYNADPHTLHRLVFNSVIGKDWHLRLRGYEVDDRPTKLGMVGRQFVLDTRTSDNKKLLPRFQYLCETTGKKLRFNNVDARGLLVWANFQSGDNWYQRKMFKTSFYTDQDIYRRALYLFNQRPNQIVTAMGITCYKLEPSSRSQPSLFDDMNKQEWLTEAVDDLNERFGNFIIHSANSLDGKKIVKQKIPFGGTKYFELLLNRS